jgi:hypothetical protein
MEHDFKKFKFLEILGGATVQPEPGPWMALSVII